MQDHTSRLNRADENALSHFSVPVRNLLRDILTSPEARSITEKEQVRQAELRRNLNARRLTLLQTATTAGEEPALIKRAQSAASNVEAAELALRNAKEALTIARNTIDAAPGHARSEAVQIERQLRATADERFADFRGFLDRLHGPVVDRHDMWIETTEEKSKSQVLTSWFFTTKLKSNTDHVKAAHALLQGLRTRSFEAELEGRTFSENTELLTSWCSELGTLLAPLRLQPPTVDRATGEVKEPIKS